MVVMHNYLKKPTVFKNNSALPLKIFSLKFFLCRLTSMNSIFLSTSSSSIISISFSPFRSYQDPRRVYSLVLSEYFYPELLALKLRNRYHNPCRIHQQAYSCPRAKNLISQFYRNGYYRNGCYGNAKLRIKFSSVQEIGDFIDFLMMQLNKKQPASFCQETGRYTNFGN